MSKEYRYEAKKYVQNCNESELLELVQIFRQTRDLWEKVQPGWLFLIVGGYNDLLRHEIIKVDRGRRTLLVRDHSRSKKPTRVINFMPSNIFETEEELQEYIDSLPPSFF